MTRALRRLLEALRNDRGAAATEFALIVPLLAVLTGGVIDATHRVRVIDGFERALFQFGDLVSREPEIEESFVEEVYDTFPKFMSGRFDHTTEVTLRISSIGGKNNGDPLILWTRTQGAPPPLPALSRYVDMAGPGETIIVVQATIEFESFGRFFGFPSDVSTSRELAFRPRVTRAIAIGGKVVDDGVTWDAYDGA